MLRNPDRGDSPAEHTRAQTGCTVEIAWKNEGGGRMGGARVVQMLECISGGCEGAGVGPMKLKGGAVAQDIVASSGER